MLAVMQRVVSRAKWQLILVILLCGMVSVSQAADFPDLELPDNMSVEIVARQMQMDTLNARVFAFRTDDSPDQLEVYFARQWQHVAREEAGPWDVLSHRKGGFLITVQSRTDVGVQTQGFIAITDLFDAAEEERESPSLEFPLPRNTDVLQDIRSEDAGRRSRTVVMKSDLSLMQGLDYYRRHFRQKGYEPLSRGALSRGQSAGSMILNRGGETIDVSAASSDIGTIITIVKIYK